MKQDPYESPSGPAKQDPYGQTPGQPTFGGSGDYSQWHPPAGQYQPYQYGHYDAAQAAYEAERQRQLFYETQLRVTAASKSFITPAVLVLVLYFVLWLPGLIANIVYLQEAINIQRITGQAPEGKGCLIALLVAFISVPLLVCCLWGGFFSALLTPG